MARFRLIPREERFFEDFVAWPRRFAAARGLLKQMLAVDPPDAAKADAIKDVEHVCDGRTRAIIDRLNRTFVTPLDREDIHALAISLDDVMDAIDAAAAVIAPVQDHATSGPAPGGWPRSSSIRPTASPRRSPRSRRQQGVARTRRPRQSARARSRSRAPGRHRRAVRRGARSDRRHQVEGDSSTSSKRPPIAARTSAICSKASSSSTASTALTHGPHPARRSGADRGRADLRLHQRLPRRGQLDRHRRLDPRAVARARPSSGRHSSTSSRRSASARRSPRRSARAWST